MPRLPALDALRGILALIVVAYHVGTLCGSFALFWPSQAAVWVFFIMSGLVLTRGYDGRFGVFAARRVIRLWPIYIVTLVAAHLLQGTSLVLGEALWLPSGAALQGNFWHAANPPSWSLYIEVWATALIPAACWLRRGSIVRGAVVAPIWLVAVMACGPLGFFAGFFLLGAWLGRWNLRCVTLEGPALQWFGRLSFSLYLSHWWVLRVGAAHGPWGLAAAVPVCGLVAYALWRWVEMPSMKLSRQIGAGFLAISPALA
jgi:peptidoglycan/LPS O-acetylase OafA/YrhL